MDLISIKRKYRNIHNIIIAIFIVTMIFIFIIVLNEINNRRINKQIYLSYSKQNEQAHAKEQEIIEQKRLEEEKAKKEKRPVLTELGKANIANLYHSDVKKVFLTFDDGPSKTVSTQILDILKEQNIKATFFLLGSRVELYPDIVKREYDEGHFLASHGYSHVYSQIYASPQSVLDEYNKSVESIRNAIGDQEYNPHLFRFPGGYSGGKYANIKKEADEILKQNDIAHIDWNALTGDSAGNKTTGQFIAELDKTVSKYNSIVVLMHDAGGKKATVEALPNIISYFRDRGFEFDNFYSVIK